MGQIKQLMNLIKLNNNPQMALNNMIMNNPQVQQANNYIQQFGGNAKDAFYNLAQQKGVNPDDVLNMLK